MKKLINSPNILQILHEKLLLYAFKICQIWSHCACLSSPITVFLNGPIPASFCLFLNFLITISIQIEKSIDGVLGIRTLGRRMVGADETTELWRLTTNHSLTRQVSTKKLIKSSNITLNLYEKLLMYVLKMHNLVTLCSPLPTSRSLIRQISAKSS